MLEITEVRVYPVNNKKTGIVANANVCFNDMLVLKGFRIIKYERNKMFVGWPRRESDGEYYDSAYVLDKGIRDTMNECILDEYEKTIAEADENPRKRGRK